MARTIIVKISLPEVQVIRVTASTLSSGGIGGSIANQQVAFGNGTAIAGNDELTWDNANGILNAYSIAIGGTGTADNGDIRFLEGFSIYAGASDFAILVGTAPSFQIGDSSSNNINLQDQNVISINADSGSIINLSVSPGKYVYVGGELRIAGVASIADVLTLEPIAHPSSPVEGMVHAGIDHHLYYYNGTVWKQLD